MNEIPSGSINWRLVEEQPHLWTVEELAAVFLAHGKGAKRNCPWPLIDPGPLLINGADSEEAKEWLRSVAIKNVDSYATCRQCGHPIKMKVEFFPYCGDSCLRFSQRHNKEK